MAAESVTTEVEKLPESRVRVLAEVQPQEIERRVEAAARELGRGLKLPGFRKGKIPPPVVIRRIGRDAVLDEAVRGSIGRWYTAAVGQAGISPIGDPKLELGEMPHEGEPLKFTIEIGVRPVAKLGDWQGLEVARREPAADEEELERQLEQIRERLARLETVERAAAEGDFVVIDYEGSVAGEPIDGGAARDQLLELGAGRLIPGFEEGLVGAAAGEQRTLELEFPQEYGNADLGGKAATFEISVKEVKEKKLPELDDDFAVDAAGFDTLEELREDIRARMLVADGQRVEREFREGCIDVLAGNAQVTVPEELARARAAEAWERTLHTLSRQGISKEAYLQISQKSEEEILAEALPDAQRSLAREASVAALIELRDVQPSDEELIAALAEQVEPDESGKTPDPAKLFEQLRKSGRLDELREDVAATQAVDALVAASKPITPGKAAARAKLWTPGSD